MAMEEKAEATAWEYAFAPAKTLAVKTAVELGIPELLAAGDVSLSSLSAGTGVPSDPLYRVMRFLCHLGIFRAVRDGDSVHYAATPLSTLLNKDKIGAFILLHGTPPGISGGLNVEALRTGKRPELKKAAENGEHAWTDPSLSHVTVFTNAMTNHARMTTAAVIRNHSEGFRGVGSLVDVGGRHGVDVGGRHGVAVGELVKAFPTIRGICLDLPEIVAEAPPLNGVELVGGNMFESIPKADVVMLMWVLHDWSDEACIDVLKKCKEAIPVESGKVMIIDAVIDEEGEGEGDEFSRARLMLDMMMLAVSVKGRERSYKEWVRLLTAANFTRHSVHNIRALESVIEAYP